MDVLVLYNNQEESGRHVLEISSVRIHEDTTGISALASQLQLPSRYSQGSTQMGRSLLRLYYSCMGRLLLYCPTTAAPYSDPTLPARSTDRRFLIYRSSDPDDEATHFPSESRSCSEYSELVGS